MNPVSQFYCDYNNSLGSEFSYENTSSVSDNNNGVVAFGDVQPESESPPVTVESYGSALPEFGFGYFHGGVIQSFCCCGSGGGDHEYCSAGGYFHQDFKPIYSSSSSLDHWGMESNNNGMGMGSMEESSVKVGRYSVEERKDRILRYLKKKNQRNFNKTIKYECRKTLADRRVRIRGRFARNNELSEDEIIIKNNNNNNNNNNIIINNNNLINPLKDQDLYSSTDILQMKQDEEWIQEAMASLMYLPYITG